MNKNNIYVLVIISILMTACQGEVTQDLYSIDNKVVEVIALEESSSNQALVIEVYPHVELITGVFAMTDAAYNKPKEIGNDYYREILQYLEPYRDHDAFVLAQKLDDSGFAYDAPLAYILHFGSLEDLNREVDFNNYVLARAGSEEILSDFTASLYELATISDFYDGFYMEHNDVYDSLKLEISEMIQIDDIIEFNTMFYGDLDIECVTVLTPALFPIGGYSVHIETEDSNTFYNIQRPRSISNDIISYDSRQINTSTVHEWGHVYVNSVVHDLISEFDMSELRNMYLPVEDVMLKSGYNTMEVYLDELIVRAITSTFTDLYMEESYLEKDIDFNKRAGFYLAEYSLEFTKDYLQANSSIDLEDYIRRIVDGYLSNYLKYLAD